MAQARWALALTLLLVALPARHAGAAPWQAQAVALEEEEAPREGSQAGPGPGESALGTAGPEYQDGRGQSSVETSKVLREILRELKMIIGGVRSLRLSSAVSRRSASARSSEAEPDAEPDAADAVLGRADSNAEPDAADAVLGRADSNAVDANSFQTYCIEGVVAILGSMLLGMVLCCVLYVWRKRRK